MSKLLTTSLVNIDSSFRNVYPKNICKSNNKLLPNNPLTLEKNSNIITINYPNHGLSTGDNIIIQNVEGNNKILNNSIYLIDNFNYGVIYLADGNLIDVDYKNYTSDLYINIAIFNSQTENNFIYNIPFNYLIGFKKVLIANDLANINLTTLNDLSTKLFGEYNLDKINEYCLFFELPYKFLRIGEINTLNYLVINQTFIINYLQIGGIRLGYFNANYPVNNYNYQSSHTVYTVINNNIFQIQLNSKSFTSISAGGNKIQISKIINSIIGYPDADNYIINLKKSFNNVVNIELVSSEFPYVDILIKKNINDKLYWKHIEDGDYIYSVQIDEGFYTTSTLLNKLQSQINNIERINSTNINRVYNYFDIILEDSTQKIIFKPYNLIKLPNSFSVSLATINSEQYYILNVNHPNNILSVGDRITISLSNDVTFKKEVKGTSQIISIANYYFNKEHIIYSVNLESQTYNIILGKEGEIALSYVTYDSAGGENITIKCKTKVQFLFNKSDTIGDIIGLRNVGEDNSITDFVAEFSNQDNYIDNINLDSVGNQITYNSGYFNMVGKYNYFLMYLNDIEFIYSNNNLPSAFAKILLTGNPGDILFNTFVKQPNNIYSPIFPISTLAELNIKFLYPDGNRVNFRNINHSFTLIITEEKIQNDNTYLNSNTISIVDELKNASL